MLIYSGLFLQHGKQKKVKKNTTQFKSYFTVNVNEKKIKVIYRFILLQISNCKRYFSVVATATNTHTHMHTLHASYQ